MSRPRSGTRCRPGYAGPRSRPDRNTASSAPRCSDTGPVTRRQHVTPHQHQEFTVPARLADASQGRQTRTRPRALHALHVDHNGADKKVTHPAWTLPSLCAALRQIRRAGRMSTSTTSAESRAGGRRQAGDPQSGVRPVQPDVVHITHLAPPLDVQGGAEQVAEPAPTRTSRGPARSASIWLTGRGWHRTRGSCAPRDRSASAPNPLPTVVGVGHVHGAADLDDVADVGLPGLRVRIGVQLGPSPPSSGPTGRRSGVQARRARLQGGDHETPSASSVSSRSLTLASIRPSRSTICRSSRCRAASQPCLGLVESRPRPVLFPVPVIGRPS
jgi:hypothetical protein